MTWGVQSGSRHAECRGTGGFELAKVLGALSVCSPNGRAYKV